MKYVKAKIARDLFDALYEANMADADFDRNANDLDSVNSCQDSLYGHLANALKSLGYEKEYLEWIETGDRPVI